MVLDPGIVIEYMTKYVTKSESMTTKTAARLMASLFTRTVTNEGRSVQSFLRRTMNKLMGDRMMSKQETCHLMLSIPMVYSTHSLVNIDLRNSYRQLDLSSSDGMNDDEETDESENNILRMSRIDAYANRMDISNWKYNHEFNGDALEHMSLQDFCLKYYVVKRGEYANKIAIDTHKYVVNFYPCVSSSPTKPTYTQYCKYALMKYKPWNGQVDEIWGGENASDDDIQNIWNTFVPIYYNHP